jgi:hypothetical protein
MGIPSTSFILRKQNHGGHYTLGGVSNLACSFGISTAPGEYQARMANVVLGEFYLKGCIIHIDDTVIHGADLESSLSVLDQVLRRMVSYNVRLKPSMCYFGFEEIEFL